MQGLIEGLHTVGLTGLEGGVDLGDFVLADEVAHGRCGIRISCAATRPLPSRVFSRVWEMMARKDSDNMERTISFFACGEYVDNTVDGFGGASCVQRAENQVAGFGGGQGEGDGFRVAHLTDQKSRLGLRAVRNAVRW